MNFPVQHLADEAVAAFADGRLGTGARTRAAHHIEQCPECAAAIAEQRAAACALRLASVPQLPAGLLERLRAVPSTTPLTPRPMGLDPSGCAVFPAYGTTEQSGSRDVNIGAVSSAHFHFPVALPRRVGRRTQQFALLTATAAMLTLGVAASASASTSSEERTPSFSPASPGVLRPAVYPASRRQPAPAELVGAVTSHSAH